MENRETTAASGAISEAERLKARHGKVYRVGATLEPDDDTSIDKQYFFKRPSAGSFDRYIKTASQNSVKALRSFLFDNVVDESRAELESDLEEYPALVISLGDKLMVMMGLSKQTNLTRL